MSKKISAFSISSMYSDMLDFCCDILHPSRSAMLELCIENQFSKQLYEVYGLNQLDILRIKRFLYTGKISIDTVRAMVNEWSYDQVSDFLNTTDW